MKTVAVIFGGQSTEHDVSVVTGIASIIAPLEASGRYIVEAVYITKKGQWIWDSRLKDIRIFRTGEIENIIQKAPKTQLEIGNGLTLVAGGKRSLKKKIVSIDVVFPALHGTNGEDGALMGLLQMANVPFVGCSMASSVLAMDKVLAKQVTGTENIPSTPWVWASAAECRDDQQKVLARISKLSYPLFVKPAHLGSSIGISKVSSKDELVNALEVAAHYDSKIIIEEAVDNLIEVTLPIMGSAENPLPALLEQPVIASEAFFDFETKYMQGGKKGKNGQKSSSSQGYSIIPAKLEPALYESAVKIACDTYTALGCDGIARVDLLINSKTKKIYFNEVNPLPGGLYAHNWRKAGKSGVDLVAALIDRAEERHKETKQMTTSFTTNYLKQF